MKSGGACVDEGGHRAENGNNAIREEDVLRDGANRRNERAVGALGHCESSDYGRNLGATSRSVRYLRWGTGGARNGRAKK